MARAWITGTFLQFITFSLDLHLLLPLLQLIDSLGEQLEIHLIVTSSSENSKLYLFGKLVDLVRLTLVVRNTFFERLDSERMEE